MNIFNIAKEISNNHFQENMKTKMYADGIYALSEVASSTQQAASTQAPTASVNSNQQSNQQNSPPQQKPQEKAPAKAKASAPEEQQKNPLEAALTTFFTSGNNAQNGVGIVRVLMHNDFQVKSIDLSRYIIQNAYFYESNEIFCLTPKSFEVNQLSTCKKIQHNGQPSNDQDSKVLTQALLKCGAINQEDKVIILNQKQINQLKILYKPGKDEVSLEPLKKFRKKFSDHEGFIHENLRRLYDDIAVTQGQGRFGTFNAG